MNTPPAPPQLRPLGLGEILDVSIRICLRHWRTLIKIVLVVTVPVQLLNLVVLVSTAPDSLRETEYLDRVTGTVDETGSAAFLGGQVVTTVIGVLAALLATGACFKAIGDAYLGTEPDWRSSLRFALRRAHSLLWVMFLSTMIPVLALVALVVPGVWLWLAFSLAVPVLLLERVKGLRALRRSFRLVAHRWWATAGTIFIGFMLAGAATGMLGILIAIPIVVGGSYLVVLVVSTLAGALSSLVSTPFQAAIIALIYFDLRVRKEGLDIELLAERMGATGPRGPGLVPQPRWAQPQPSPWQTAPERPGESASEPFAPPYERPS
ncbi:MAG: hypothetical protein ACR2ML_12175 [Solirubrobacteraceae bacterium]